VKRARDLQKYEEPKYRELHSKLVLSNVLKERDLQIEYKMKRKLADKIYEKEEILRMRLEHLNNLDKDLEKQNDVIERQHEFERGLAKDVLKRKAEKNKYVLVYLSRLKIRM
jgi:aromatic ring-opening dioxygenase LigB subunit